MSEESPLHIVDGIYVTPLKINEYPLPGGLTAKWQLEPIGLQNASESDKLVVRMEIWLPCTPDGKYLHLDCRFGKRCTMFHCELSDTWGYDKVGFGYRQNFSSVTGTTWLEALLRGAKQILKELKLLSDMMQVRQDAMHSEGWVLVETARAFTDNH